MDEWGPWLKAPCPNFPMGAYVQIKFDGEVFAVTGGMFLVDSRTIEGIASKSVRLDTGDNVNSTRYRVRKPRGMSLLEQIAANPPKELIKENV